MEQFDLNQFQKNPDGTYSKRKTVSQPRELSSKIEYKKTTPESFNGIKDLILIDELGHFQDNKIRKVSLTLFGIPMPKQSVRLGKNKDGDIHFHQPTKNIERKKNYRQQIISQLPSGFVRFENIVHVKKMHFVFPPLKAFHKIKGRMDAIRNGEKFWKNTKPDLPDNLKKLVNDSMSELVFKDDSIIVSENGVEKYYGTGGCIILELEGY